MDERNKNIILNLILLAKSYGLVPEPPKFSSYSPQTLHSWALNEYYRLRDIKSEFKSVYKFLFDQVDSFFVASRIEKKQKRTEIDERFRFYLNFEANQSISRCELTITCPFAGKTFCIDEVLESMAKLKIPPFRSVQWIFLDTSGSPQFRSKLVKFRPKAKVYSVPKSTYSFSSMDGLYNDLKASVSGYWMSLEDDVAGYSPEIIHVLLEHLLDDPYLGIVAAAVPIRRGQPGPLAWNVKSMNGELGLQMLKPRSEGRELVDATHLGCTLIRPYVHEDYTFRQTGSSNRIIGQDIYFCLDAKENKNLNTMVIWKESAQHYTELGPISLNVSVI